MKQGGADHGTQPGTLFEKRRYAARSSSSPQSPAFDFLLLFPFPLQLGKSQIKSFKISQKRYFREK